MPTGSESRSGNLDPACSQQRAGQQGKQLGNSRDGAILPQKQPHPQNILFQEGTHQIRDGGQEGRGLQGSHRHRSFSMLSDNDRDPYGFIALASTPRRA